MSSVVTSFDQFFVFVIIEMNCSSGMATTRNAVFQARAGLRVVVGFFPFRQLIILSTRRNAHSDSRSTHQSVGNGRHWRIHLQNKQWIKFCHKRIFSLILQCCQKNTKENGDAKSYSNIVLFFHLITSNNSFLRAFCLLSFLPPFSCENIGVKFFMFKRCLFAFARKKCNIFMATSCGIMVSKNVVKTLQSHIDKRTYGSKNAKADLTYI